jgi:PBP1b-binding outer membrane lipoprotein LpoB
MNTRTAVVGALAFLALTLTACSSDSGTTSSKPSTTSAKAYTYEDCVDLLEYDLQEGQLQDASGDPECSHLTRDRYKDAVAEVLTAHKDEILDSAQ